MASIAVSAAVIGAFWLSLIQYRSLVGDRAVQSLERVYPVAGLLVDLTSDFEAIDAGTASSGLVELKERRGRTLLLLSSDSCRHTRTVTALWTAVLERLSLRGGDEVVVVSVDGDEVPKLLQAHAEKHGVPIRLLRSEFVPGFITATGLSQTPSTVLLDERSRIARIVMQAELRSGGSTIVDHFANSEEDEHSVVDAQS